jgi:hypothetical protein
VVLLAVLIVLLLPLLPLYMIEALNLLACGSVIGDVESDLASTASGEMMPAYSCTLPSDKTQISPISPE